MNSEIMVINNTIDKFNEVASDPDKVLVFNIADRFSMFLGSVCFLLTMAIIRKIIRLVIIMKTKFCGWIRSMKSIILPRINHVLVSFFYIIKKCIENPVQLVLDVLESCILIELCANTVMVIINLLNKIQYSKA